MRVELRIVAGSLKGRKLRCTVTPKLRPTPQMVREALFSILGDAVPGRPFFDLFGGTGVVGLEALSRGASSVTFVERDFRLAQAIEDHLKEFDLADCGKVVRGEVYRWARAWQAPAEPVTLFLSPPFIDFERRPDEFFDLVALLRQKIAGASVLVLQSERGALELLPDRQEWDERHYGRNELFFWVKGDRTEVTHDGA
jgi:16S rRNA (guanine(966)-N(2))-methyltransferase RsmD